MVAKLKPETVKHLREGVIMPLDHAITLVTESKARHAKGYAVPVDWPSLVYAMFTDRGKIRLRSSGGSIKDDRARCLWTMVDYHRGRRGFSLWTPAIWGYMVPDFDDIDTLAQIIVTKFFRRQGSVPGERWERALYG